MINLVALALLLLSAVNLYIGRRWSYPPFVFSTVWFTTLTLLVFAGKIFRPITIGSLLVYLVGATTFTLGGSLAVLTGEFRTNRSNRRKTDTVVIQPVIMLLLVLAVLLPLYYTQVISLGHGFENVWHGIRATSIRTEILDSNRIDLVDNLVPLSSILAFIAFYRYNGSRSSKSILAVAVVFAITYNLLTMAASGLTYLALGLVGIQGTKSSKLPVKTFTVSTLIFLFSFSASAIIVGKGSVNDNASLTENLPAVWDTLHRYILGGVVAFDQVVQEPESFTASWDPTRFFMLAANKLGAEIDVLPRHAQFVSVGNGIVTNVYTFYFSYFPSYGWVGVVLSTLLFGFVSTLTYMFALRRSPVAAILYASLFAGICLSGFTEGFFLNFDFLLKSLVATVLIFSFPQVTGFLKRSFTSFSST